MGKSKIFTEEEKEKIIYEYTILKRGVNAIGRNFNTSGTTIQRHLKKWGVKVRNLTETMQEIRAYNVNDNFFKSQSHDMAYILGLLASDGCVSKSTNHWYIDLSIIDEEILYHIKEVIGFEGPIQYYTNNSNKKYARLRVCSSIMKNDLAHYNITPQKTFTLLPPLFLDKQYQISYIRGLFDGDGCIHINKEKYKYNWYICNARKEILVWVQEILLNNYGIISNIHTKKNCLSNGDNFYYLQIYKKETILNLFQVLYIDDSLYLKRKYDIFKNFYDIKSTRPYSLSDKENRYAELIQNEE